MPRLILLTGPQASGKSTYIKELSLKLDMDIDKDKFIHIKDKICIVGKYNMERRLGEFDYSSGGGTDNHPPDHLWETILDCYLARNCNVVITEGVIHCWRSGRGRTKTDSYREESYEYLEDKIEEFKLFGINVILVHLKVSKDLSETRYENRYPSKWGDSKIVSRTAEKTYDKIISDINWMKKIVNKCVEIDTERNPKEVLQEIENLVRSSI